MGRPSSFTTEKATSICERIMEGESLRRICLDDSMPSKFCVLKWLKDFPEFATQYAHAREIQADTLFDQISEIANDGSKDWVMSKFGPVVDSEHVQRSRLRVDTLKWQASKLNAKKYGDKQLHAGADGEGPVEFVVTRAGTKEK